MTVSEVPTGYSRSLLSRHSTIVCGIASCLISLTSDPHLPLLTLCRSGALQPQQSVWEGPVPPAASPQCQPGSALWPQQPSECRSLSLHAQPPGGLLHPAAAGACVRVCASHSHEWPHSSGWIEHFFSFPVGSLMLGFLSSPNSVTRIKLC